MDRQHIQERESRCIQEQPPACSTGCPLHVDARGLAEAVGKGDFPAAFALFARSVPFPSIIGRICDRPCEQFCKRAEAGDAVAIRALERAAVEFGYGSAARPKPPRGTRSKRIAVIGAGLSGLTAAIDLTVKGRQVVVFEAGERALERLRALPPELLPTESVERDLQVLTILGIDIRFGARIADSAAFAALVEEYDAVYLGTGSAPLPFAGLAVTAEGRAVIDAESGATSHPKVFAGGGQRYGDQFSAVTSIFEGRFAAQSIERLLQGASLTANRDDRGSYPTRLYTNTSRFTPLPVVAPADAAAGYSREEAMREAARCFPCQCLECVRVCEYLEHYGSYPKRYVREIYNNDCIVMGAHKSNRMANSCSLCGLCATVCPEGLGMAETCLEARCSMVEKGKMPPSAHDFALRDMAFSTSDAFALARHQPGHDSSAALFFPGCQLSASSPDHVARTYAHLRETLPGGVGLLLGCCGAPAHWAGQEALYQQTHAELVEQWERMGRPQIVAACSTCVDMLRPRLPEGAVTSLWSVFERHGLPESLSGHAARLALHDPCTTRQSPETRQAVRTLLSRLGVEIEELNEPGHNPCCGFGGLMEFANPAIADKVVDRRVGESDTDYLAYCAMCRDNFARRGKRSVHLLDLIFPPVDGDPAARPDPGFSGRHEGRARLKTRLLREVWNEDIMPEAAQIRLTLSPEVQAKAERRLILLDDIRQVIAAAEQSGAVIRNPATGRTFANRRLAFVTYWVEYSPDADGFTVHSAYSHRMDVVTEASS